MTPLPRIDPGSVRPGDFITVRVGGVEYQTTISAHGTQRFVEDPDNPLLKRLRRSTTGGYNPQGDVEDLNAMALLYQRGGISQREYAEMNIANGYSVSGFCDLGSFDDMDIDNPLWDAPEEPDPNDVVPLGEIPRTVAAVLLAALSESEEIDRAAHGTAASRQGAKEFVERLRALVAGEAGAQ